MTPIKKLLYDLVDTLTKLEIEYAVMGGWAVRSYGLPRPTYDVDVTISVDRKRLPELFSHLDDLGYPADDVYRQGWTDQVGGMPLVKVTTLVEGRTIRGDIFLAENPFQRSMMRRRALAEVNGIHVWVVSPEDLILLKLVAARPRDTNDVWDIIFVQGQLDSSYMRTWAAKLGVTDQLEDALKRFA